jgi:hypothetical protein
MKKIINFKIVLLALLPGIILIGSCRKSFFYDGINNDPNQVSKSQLTPSVLLNGAELSIGYTVGGDISRYTSVLDQYVQGAVRQFSSYNKYIFSAQDFDNVWANVYEQGLNNLNTLRSIADANGYGFYSGISRVLLAYEFGLATDLWGDIPRTQALRGTEGILQPVYDKQQDIYPYLQATLDSAITFLSGNAGGNIPGADDFIYNGNVSSWKAFANSLKARYYLHLSKVDPSYADKVLGIIANGISSSAKNAVVPFFDNETQANPWYQYLRDRGDISYIGSYFNQQLKSLSDPRADAYIDQSNDVPTGIIAGRAAPVTLLSYTEALFMKAEALSAKNDPGAVAAYNAAVQSAFNDAGVAMPVGYLVSNGLTGTDHPSRLPQIIQQKYFALFTQPEAYNDWRRTGYPSLAPNVGTSIPRRFLYPQAELSYNKANVPSGLTLFSKVWWDQ